MNRKGLIRSTAPFFTFSAPLCRTRRTVLYVFRAGSRADNAARRILIDGGGDAKDAADGRKGPLCATDGPDGAPRRKRTACLGPFLRSACADDVRARVCRRRPASLRRPRRLTLIFTGNWRPIAKAPSEREDRAKGAHGRKKQRKGKTLTEKVGVFICEKSE